jgi:hypothetical protein
MSFMVFCPSRSFYYGRKVVEFGTFNHGVSAANPCAKCSLALWSTDFAVSGVLIDKETLWRGEWKNSMVMLALLSSL